MVDDDDEDEMVHKTRHHLILLLLLLLLLRATYLLGLLIVLHLMKKCTLCFLLEKLGYRFAKFYYVFRKILPSI